MFWNFLLNGFALSTDFRQKRFKVSYFFSQNYSYTTATGPSLLKVVVAVLKKLNEVELNTKQTFDIIPRLILDLPNFTAEQLVELTELQMDGLKLGDPKCIGWKDLLPQLLSLLQNMPERFIVNDISTTGIDFCRKQIESITDMKWHLPIPVADMFRYDDSNINVLINIYSNFLVLLQTHHSEQRRQNKNLVQTLRTYRKNPFGRASLIVFSVIFNVQFCTFVGYTVVDVR
jgi:hypothetical protein